MSPRLAIGIDLGGTNIKGAVVSSNGIILDRLEQPTDAARGPGPVMDDLADMVRRLQQRPPIPHERKGTVETNESNKFVGIGLATPGPLDLHAGRINHAANLPGWKDVRIRDSLREKTGLPVTLENDGNAAAYGEYRYGAGVGHDDLVMLTLGTGVGGGVILNGEIIHGHFDNAAELGHMIVVVDGFPCPCGQRGCLEQYASAGAIVRRVLSVDPGRKRMGADDLRAEDIITAALNGDPLCYQVWDEACQFLAVACINIQHAYNPSKIILGGGMSNAGAQLLDRVNAHFSSQAWSLHNDVPMIVLAKLGKDAGVVGCAALAFASR